MVKILTFGRSGDKIPKENLLRIFWDWFSSQDKFTRYSILTLLLIIIATPFIVNNYLETRQKAEKPSQAQSLQLPANNRSKGLVYDGLEPDTSGKCKGLFKLKGNFPALLYSNCTHGPDPAPEGIDINKSVEPISAQEQQNTVLGTTVTCDGDGTSGTRIQLIYARASDKTDRYSTYLTSFQTWAAGMDSIYNSSAQDTGGSRHVRFVHDSSCTPVVENVVLSTAGDDTYSNTVSELSGLGYNRIDRKYLIFEDALVYCGLGNQMPDDQPGSSNDNNNGQSYARVDAGCWNANIAAHELMHTLGGVQLSAPHTSGGWHCVDESDIICYSDYPNYPPMQILCSDPANENKLDCNHDDYYSTNPVSNSYLATHWNTANNIFLINPSVPQSVLTPTPTPIPQPPPPPQNSPCTPVGDVNDDDIVSIGDAQKIARYTIGLETFTESQKWRADVDGNGSVTIGDSQKISRFLIGLEPTFAACTADTDIDNFKNPDEIYFGTNPWLKCSLTSTANDEVIDNWPPDLTDDKLVSLSDTLLFNPLMGVKKNDSRFKSRFDLNRDGVISLGDILKLNPYFNKPCN